MRSPLPFAGALLALVSGLSAQQDTSRLSPAEATAVVVDVVVRDGTGRPVTDLGPKDFEVFEDGVSQVIERFAPPGDPRGAETAGPSGALSGGPGAASAASSTPVRGRSTMAFVLDRLSTEGCVAAERALRDHLRERQAGDVAGLFSLENTLVVVQDFTGDATLLQAAVEAVGSRAGCAGASRLDQARALAGGRLAANAARAVLLETRTPRSNADAVANARARIAAAQASMAQAAAEAFDRLERDQHGFVTANALTAIVDALRPVPGRKAVVLFSEGLFRTEANEQRFLAAVNAANRASVSVYAVEAAGLQVKSYESVARDEMVSASQLTMARQSAAEDLGGGSWLRSLESVEDTVRFHPRASLEWITESTGGLFWRDINDLTGALREIGADLRSYYLLGYTPRNEIFDGRFRKITVTARRKGVVVRARSGYFAVRTAGPVLAHVAPALAVLEAGQRPRDLPVYAAAWAFPNGEAPVRVPVAISVPVRELARLASPKRGKGALDLTLLARIHDASGRPVEAMSRRFVFEPRAAPKAAELRLLRDAWLTPGRYRLEAVAYEASSSRAGVASFEFEVAGGADALRRPQVVIVRGAQPAAQVELETGHPLRFGDVVLQPLTGQPVPREPAHPLVFQLVTFADGVDPPSASVGVFRENERVGESGVQWGATEPGGIRRCVSEAPTGPLRAGRYELRVTLRDATGERTLRAPFVVTE